MYYNAGSISWASSSELTVFGYYVESLLILYRVTAQIPTVSVIFISFDAVQFLVLLAFSFYANELTAIYSTHCLSSSNVLYKIVCFTEQFSYFLCL